MRLDSVLHILQEMSGCLAVLEGRQATGYAPGVLNTVGLVSTAAGPGSSNTGVLSLVVAVSGIAHDGSDWGIMGHSTIYLCSVAIFRIGSSRCGTCCQGENIRGITGQSSQSGGWMVFGNQGWGWNMAALCLRRDNHSGWVHMRCRTPDVGQWEVLGLITPMWKFLPF